MPDIRWDIPDTFRRKITRQIMYWDFRVQRDLNVAYPITSVLGEVPTGTDIPHITLTVDVEVKVEDGKAKREFVVKPKSPGDLKLIQDWMNADERRKAWLREGDVT